MDGKRVTHPLCWGHRITIAVALSVLLAGSLFAQGTPMQKECENLLLAAVRAEQQNDLIEAELRYDECLMLAKKYRLPKMEAKALHRLAVIRARNKKFSESAQLFRRAHELDPQNALILSDFAQLHADRKDFDEAEKLFKRALDADPNNPKILFNLGSTIASQRGNREAEGLRYLKLAVGEAEAYRELARIYRSKGDLSRAEFADQKAQIAESQPTQPSATRVGANAPSGNNAVPVRPPHQVQTPPAIIQRNRQDIINSEVRDVISAQQRPATPPTAQTPPIPTPPIPAPAHRPAAMTERRVAATITPPAEPAKPSPSVAPADPFAKTHHRQEPTSSFVRQLQPPQAALGAPSEVRTIPSHSKPLPVIQSSDQSSISSPFAPIQVEGIDSVITVSPEPQLAKITSPVESDTLIKTDIYSSRSLRPLATEGQSASVPPVKALPSGARPAERTDMVKTNNPLRQIPLDDSGLIDPVSEVSVIAALPSYTALGNKRIPRIDQTSSPERSKNVPIVAEPPSSSGFVALETVKPVETVESPIEVARAPRALPVRDVSVLQPPSADFPHGESRGSQSVSAIPAPAAASDTHHIAQLFAERSETVTAIPEYVKITRNERHFSSANAPEVLQFSLASRDVPPAVPSDKSVEIAARPPRQDDAPLVARSVVALPLVADGDSGLPPMERIVSTVPPPAPAVAVIDDPFLTANKSPVPTEVRTFEVPVPIIAANNDPFLTANKPPTPNSHSLVIADRQLPGNAVPESLPRVVSQPVEVPKVADARPVLPTPRVEPPQPILVLDEPTGFASTRKPEPQKIAASDDSAGFARSKK